MDCDSCGKNMDPPAGGTPLVGMMCVQRADASATDEMKEYLAQQLGPYQVGRTYHACWECLLKAQGLKP